VRGESPSYVAAAKAALPAAVLALLPAAAGAAPGVDVVLAPFGGAVSLDSRLSDYRWDTDVRPAWGLAGFASLGRVEPGVRVWRASTAQGTGIPGDETALDVSLTGFEATAAVRLAGVAGFRLLGTGSAGLLRIGWSPSSLAIDAGGGGPITVRFDPVTEPVFGAGLAVRRGVGAGFELGVGLERSWFRLDTAHRAGTAIVEDRETFGNWTARLVLSRSILNLGGRTP
jgi:hypothetical protein